MTDKLRSDLTTAIEAATKPIKWELYNESEDHYTFIDIADGVHQSDVLKDNIYVICMEFEENGMPFNTAAYVDTLRKLGY